MKNAASVYYCRRCALASNSKPNEDTTAKVIDTLCRTKNDFKLCSAFDLITPISPPICNAVFVEQFCSFRADFAWGELSAALI